MVHMQQITRLFLVAPGLHTDKVMDSSSDEKNKANYDIRFIFNLPAEKQRSTMSIAPPKIKMLSEMRKLKKMYLFEY